MLSIRLRRCCEELDNVVIRIANLRYSSVTTHVPSGRDNRSACCDGSIEGRLQSAPVIAVPTITIGSDFDGAAADGKPYAAKFSGPYRHQTLNGIGHNVPQEAPEAFAAAVIEANGMAKP